MPQTTPPNELSATALSAGIAAGQIGVEEAVRACLARVAARDPVVRAWAFIDGDAVLRQARELDKWPVRGPLHGIPIGVKDMIDTADMPTQHNSPVYRGHQPSLDAACVATLRAAGAIILGKTDTTEFATGGRRASTRHPLNPNHTPGGSSAGSAAAVGDCQVHIALGTQTAGSTIRPASFNGIFALKPTWGVVSREGVKLYSATLDTLTWFGRAVSDLGLLCDAFAIYDDTPPRPVTLRGARFAFCRTPMWSRAQPGTPEAMEAAAEQLRAAGAIVTWIDLPPEFDALPDMQHSIMMAEGQAAFLSLVRVHGKAAHDDFHDRVENRSGITRAQLAAAYDGAARCRGVFDTIAGAYAAVVVPSARGEAPVYEAGPGDAIFNRMWTLLHGPNVNIPVLHGPTGLPVGVTLIGPRFRDRQLLATAEAVAACVGPGRKG
jgi:Asp-tRNA(Asn)/Glu-tRNA(Gln) amidotransferase A subunit family amidase